jgi:F-type H+-transporting ATPase subunit b
MGFLTNEYTWVTTALLIFFGILYYAGAHRTVLGAIDGRSKRIADELAQARKLREDAQALLASFEARRSAAEAEAQGIVQQAREEAARIEAEGKARIEAFVKRRTEQAELKIAQAERSAAADVRNAAADAAVQAAEALLKAHGAGASASIFEESLADVRNRMN